MATLIVGVLLCVALYFALRHVVRNVKEGRTDCAGCPGGCHGCSGHCTTLKDMQKLKPQH